VSELRAPVVDSPDAHLGPVEWFLVQHLRAHPGLSFGAIIQAASSECGVSRTTAARYLSQLVRFGEVTLLPNRRYFVGGVDAPVARPTVETRWYEEVYTLFPDGSAEQYTNQEFRIVSGRIEHLEVNYSRPPEQFEWWTDLPAKASRIPSSREPNRMYSVRLDLAQTLSAREPHWHRLRTNARQARWCRMAQGTWTERGAFEMPKVVTHGTASVQTPSQSRRFSERYSSKGQMRLQVGFPEGYPFGPARVHVRFETESSRTDAAEEARLKSLSEDPMRQEGFRRTASGVSLSVPDPQLDRVYEVEWQLPTVVQLDRWLVAQGKRMSALARKDA
jgi:hypothetical protein